MNIFFVNEFEFNTNTHTLKSPTGTWKLFIPVWMVCLVAPSTNGMLYYLCRTPCATGSVIWRPYLALPRIHTQVFSTALFSTTQECLPRDCGAIVSKIHLKQARTNNMIKAAILNRVLDRDGTLNHREPLRWYVRNPHSLSVTPDIPRAKLRRGGLISSELSSRAWAEKWVKAWPAEFWAFPRYIGCAERNRNNSPT